MERQNHTLVIYPMNLISIHNLVSPCRQVTSETISMIYDFFDDLKEFPQSERRNNGFHGIRILIVERCRCWINITIQYP